MQRISNTVVGLTILDSFVLTGGLISSVSLILFKIIKKITFLSSTAIDGHCYLFLRYIGKFLNY